MDPVDKKKTVNFFDSASAGRNERVNNVNKMTLITSIILYCVNIATVFHFSEKTIKFE